MTLVGCSDCDMARSLGECQRFLFLLMILSAEGLEPWALGKGVLLGPLSTRTAWAPAQVSG